MAAKRYPLFPLSAHLLPGGRMALRIFEPRYVRMVKEACASGSGFVLCMLNARGDVNENKHIYPLGTLVSVVDFDMLDDGLLGITVAGENFVWVSDIDTEFDGLRVGLCEPQSSWACELAAADVAPMRQGLNEIFERYPEIGKLYEEPKFDDPMWVLHRWIELLPVDSVQKQAFLVQKDCHEVLNYLQQLLQ